MLRDAQRYSGVLVNGILETISFALFHAASTLSGSLRSTPSPRGEGFMSGIPLSPSNLRPFGAPPSIGRRECPREPLPLEGAAERSEAGLAFFFGRPSRLLFAFPFREGVVSKKAVFSFRSLPHWGRGTAQRRSGALVNGVLETIFPTLFHTARTLSGSLRSPPSPHGEGFVSGIAVFSYRSLPHWGRGTASAVDRVLSQTAYLRRSFPLSFIPLVPYPARSARHLPHAGKALSVGILFPHLRVFALTMRE